MSGIFVALLSPGRNTTVGRSQAFSGTIAAFNGAVNSIFIRFGAGAAIHVPGGGRAQNGLGWGWTGLIPNDIRPGESFDVTVTAFGALSTGDPNEPEPVDVDGEATGTFVLENVVPVLTMNPWQSPISTLATTHTQTFRGTVTEANPAVYGTPQVRYSVDGGPPQPATVNGPDWSATVGFAPGDHTITVQASDPFQSVATAQGPLEVLRYPVAPTTDPAVHTTPSGLPTTSSVTTWNRLEPRSGSAGMSDSTSARLLDPLWLLARQWQMGEFQAEDAGTPVQARVRATSAPLSRAHFGAIPAGTSAGVPYDPARTPLEAVVEHRPMRPAGPADPRMLTAVVDAGLHFLRLLEADPVAAPYRTAFLARYALGAAALDDDASARFVRTMAGRAPDARRLAGALRETAFDPALHIADADAPAVRQVATDWLTWYDGLFSEPSGPADDAWDPARLEYAVSVAAGPPDRPVTLSAPEFDGGRLDWSAFDVNGTAALDTTSGPAATAINATTVPAPVTVRGGPAPRFWEMEDARLAYGLLPAGPADLAHLMLIEYASTYGNDWYVVPLALDVGSVTGVDSLIVTDTFGVKDLLRPIGDPALPPPYFSLWQPADLRGPGERLGDLRDPARPLDPRVGAAVPNRFLLAPVLGRGIDGPAVEDVLFMRDEMANVAWAIERAVESAVEQPVPRANDAAAPPAADGAPRYVLSSGVPDNWIPLLPVQLTPDGGGPVVSRLRRGGVLRPDGGSTIHVAVGQVLNAAPDLLLYDEEVPREGVRVTRSRRTARWTDGSTWLWTGFRKRVGSGEGSSALTFDELVEP